MVRVSTGTVGDSGLGRFKWTWRILSRFRRVIFQDNGQSGRETEEMKENSPINTQEKEKIGVRDISSAVPSIY